MAGLNLFADDTPKPSGALDLFGDDQFALDTSQASNPLADPQTEKMSSLINAYQRGIGLDARQKRLVEELNRRKNLGIRWGQTYREEAMADLASDQNWLQSLLIGMGKGFTNVVDGVMPNDPEARARYMKTLPLLGDGGENLMQPEQAADQAYGKLKEGRPYTVGGGEIFGEAAPFVPAAVATGGIASLPLRAAASGIIGGAEGGILAEKGQSLQGASLGTAIGATAEVLFPVIGRLGRKLFQKLTGRLPQGAMLDATGAPTPELVSLMEKFGITFQDLKDDAVRLLQDGVENPEQLLRKQTLENAGLVGDAGPTKAQITRDVGDFQAQQEAAKETGRVRTRLDTQEQVLTKNFDNQAEVMGSRSPDPELTVTSAVDNKVIGLDNEINALYREAREVAPDAKNIRFNKLSALLKRKLPANTKSKGVVENVIGELKYLGLLDDNLDALARTNVANAEELRIFLNTMHDPMEPFGNQVIKELKDALDEDVFTQSGGDLFKRARDAKHTFETQLNRAKNNKFDARKTNLVRSMMENKIDPDRFVKEVVFGRKWRAEDIGQLKNYLADEVDLPFENLKRDVLDEIKNQAFQGAEDSQGFKALSRHKLDQILNERIGWKKLEEIFNPDEIKFLKDMQKVAHLREPVRMTQQGLGPTAQAVKSLEKRLAEVPIMGILIRFADFDAQGRAVIKANVKRLPSSPAVMNKIGGPVAAAVMPVAPEAVSDAGALIWDKLTSEDKEGKQP